MFIYVRLHIFDCKPLYWFRQEQMNVGRWVIMAEDMRIEEMKELLAQRLRACRKKSGYTQMQAAVYSDITETTYTNYERAQQLPRIDILVRIADVYKVSLDYLTGRTDDPKPFLREGFL